MSYYITDYGMDSQAGRLVALEDSIMQKLKPVTAGSKILADFISPFDATAVTRLEENGYTVAGKTKMSEFGLLPLCGGGDCGAVKAVADGAVKLALCNDFSGMNRRESAENGVFYIHPTYGTVSRYGLIPAAASMDQIGVVCENLAGGFELLSKIAGNDEKDGAMFPEKAYAYKGLSKKITAFAPENVLSAAIPEDRAAVMEFMKNLGSVPGTLQYFEVFRQVQYILSCAEISNNLSRYDGVKFGYRTKNYKNLEELYLNTRTEAFGENAKLAAMMGAMVLSKDQYGPYYDKALKLRRAIRDALDFGQYDIIVLPAHINGDLYENSALYALATLAGLPSVSLPFSGGGIQIFAAPKNEGALITALEVAGQ